MAVVPPTAQALVDRVGERSGFVMTLDGAPVVTDLSQGAEAAGVVLTRIGRLAEGAELLGSIQACFSGEESRDALDYLQAAFAADGAALLVPAGVVLEHPVVVVNVLARDARDEVRGEALFPRTIVRLGESAAATVIEMSVSGDGAALVMPAVEIDVGDGARLSYSSIQQLGRKSWQLGRTYLRAGRDATLRHFTASFGGEYARSRTDSLLDGQGGSAELLAAYLGDGSQTHDFRTLQEHVGPRTTSDLYFKGAVGDSARSVYSGMIRMRKGARGANAFQTNRNLVLSDGAHADSVPNLDIEENDVRCSHASAVGPIDSVQRFYLESRGVPSAVADRLILLGYFRELLERVEPAVSDHVSNAIGGRIRAMAEGEQPR
jgi:Fe-S cluster assembly protein SufD